MLKFSILHVSHVMCNVSHVIWHVTPVTSHYCYFYLIFSDKLLELVDKRFCYQWGLPRLVINTNIYLLSFSCCQVIFDNWIWQTTIYGSLWIYKEQNYSFTGLSMVAETYKDSYILLGYYKSQKNICNCIITRSFRILYKTMLILLCMCTFCGCL